MTDAPERIWIWQTYENNGQREGQWCSHTKDGTEYVRADRIEALTEQLEAARADAKEAEAYAEELEAKNKNLLDLASSEHKRAEAAEAKLAKALEALDEALYFLKPTESDMEKRSGIYRIVTTLAELKGTRK